VIDWLTRACCFVIQWLVNDVWTGWCVCVQPRGDSDKSQCTSGQLCQCPCYTSTDYSYCSGRFTITESVYCLSSFSVYLPVSHSHHDALWPKISTAVTDNPVKHLKKDTRWRWKTFLKNCYNLGRSVQAGTCNHGGPGAWGICPLQICALPPKFPCAQIVAGYVRLAECHFMALLVPHNYGFMYY